MTITVPYDWLRKVPSALVKNQEIPLFGHSSPFPWSEFSMVLEKVFKLKDVKIDPLPWQYRSVEGLYEGIGDHPAPLYVSLAPLSGLLCFVMAEHEVERLMNLLLVGDADAQALADADYRQGFYQFLALESINIISRFEFAKGLAPLLVESNAIPDAECLCQDLMIGIGELTFACRLIITEELRRSWKERYAERSLVTAVPPELQVVVHMQAGSVTLSRAEWQSATVGDLILLDHCSLEDSGDKGRVVLTLNGKPIYRAKVKDGNIKILETPLFQEIETAIKAETKQEAKLPDSFDEEFTDFDEEFTEFDVDEPETEEAAPPQHEVSHRDFSEIPASQPLESQKPEASTLSPSSLVSLNDVPLNITLEIGRLQLPIQKFMDLQPGNLIELDVRPENGVDLVLNGNVIAKGELLKIGESLGVRILDKA